MQRDVDDYYTLFSILVRDYNLPPEYVRGSYKIRCRVTGTLCTVCEGPKQVAKCEYAALFLDGISPRIGRQLGLLQVEEDWRKFVCECFYRTGKWPNDEKVSREEVEQRIEDPLHNFPYDVKYFTEAQIIKLKEAAEMQSKYFKKPLPEHRMWTPERIQACRGQFGIAARRCSVNDSLWGRYLEYKKRGIVMTLDLLRSIVRMDALVVKLQKAPESEQDELFEEILTNG